MLLAPEGEFRTFLFSGFDVAFDLLFLGEVDLRPLIGFLVELLADLDILGTLDGGLHKFIVDS